jgi:AP-3 complex subunit delta-1
MIRMSRSECVPWNWSPPWCVIPSPGVVEAEYQVDRESLQPIVDQLLAHLAPTESKGSELPSAAASLAAASAGTSQDAPTTATQLSLTPAYRLALTLRLLAIISNDTYVNVTDFEWVISVLIDVAYVSNVDVGTEIKTMLLDVVGRVKSVREYAVRMLEKVLGDEDLRERSAHGTGEDGLLEAAVWLCGEYAR